MEQLEEIKAYFVANPPEDKLLQKGFPLSKTETIANHKQFVDGHIAYIERNYDPENTKKNLTWKPYLDRLVRYYQMVKS